jgi:hypothetical protein
MFASEPSAAYEVDRFVFTPRELARLEIYRDAVLAGFYNETIYHNIDQPVSATAVLTDTPSDCRDSDTPERHR